MVETPRLQVKLSFNRRVVTCHSGESRNPGILKAFWMPDQVRHDGKVVFNQSVLEPLENNHLNPWTLESLASFFQLIGRRTKY
jgi:hypothetical protein